MENSGKIKLLVVGITMDAAGTEKSFLSFASCLDYERYDVTLLLAKKDGLFLPMLPKQLHVIEMGSCGEMFTLNGGNAFSVILRTMVRRDPKVLFDILPYALKIAFHIGRRSDMTMRMWYRLSRYFPDMPGTYDAAIAYWGDKTMFYMLDHVNAAKKIAWLHFDYAQPPREDALYEPAFARCDNIVTVSSAVDMALREHFPALSDKIVKIENICDKRLIWDLALRGETFPDRHFSGKRILTVGRIAGQKGYDLAVRALARLRADGFDVRWYIIGTGTDADVNALKELALSEGVADLLLLLGTTPNPYTYIRDCDIYVQPSRHEGKPIAVEEAKILYKTILVTGYTSAREQLEDGKLGMITDISADAVYEGLKALLRSPGLCMQYSDALTERRLGNRDEIYRFYELIQ